MSCATSTKGAGIKMLRSEMVCMSKLHLRRDGRSKRKVALLMEIKLAMEEQICFLKEGDDIDDVLVR